MFCLCRSVCLCVRARARAEGMKKPSDLLELEFQTVVISHVRAGDQTWVLCKEQ